MTRIYNLLLLAVISGCLGAESYGETVNVSNTNFLQLLQRGYNRLSDAEWQRGDQQAAKYFADKAIAIEKGEYVGPSDPTFVELDTDGRSQFIGIYNDLKHTIDLDIHHAHPRMISYAHLMYDCWLENINDDGQENDLKHCQQEFMRVKKDIDRAVREKPLKSKKQEFLSRVKSESLDVEVMPEPYIVMFDYNQTLLTKDAHTILQRVVRDYRDTKPDRMIISGHADRSGREVYNFNLAEERVWAIVRFLISEGIPNDVFDLRAYGENWMRYRTENDVKHPMNRYGMIQFVRDID